MSKFVSQGMPLRALALRGMPASSGDHSLLPRNDGAVVIDQDRQHHAELLDRSDRAFQELRRCLSRPVR